jgi:hypothetical protein
MTINYNVSLGLTRRAETHLLFFLYFEKLKNYAKPRYHDSFLKIAKGISFIYRQL